MRRKSKEIQKKSLIKNVDDLELLLSVTGISAISEFHCSHQKLNAAAQPLQSPDF